MKVIIVFRSWKNSSFKFPSCGFNYTFAPDTHFIFLKKFQCFSFITLKNIV